MTASKSESYTPLRSPRTQNSKRKAVSTPDAVTPTKRARTSQRISTEEITRANVEIPTSSRKRQKTKVIEAEDISAQSSEDAPKFESKRVKEEINEEEEDQVIKVSPSKSKRKRKEQINKKEEEEEVEESLAEAESAKTAKRQRKTKKEKVEEKDEDEVGEEDTPKKVKRKRKTKEEKEAEAMPLAARTTSLRMYIGAHVSSAKGSFWPHRWAVVLELIENRITRSAQRGH